MAEPAAFAVFFRKRGRLFGFQGRIHLARAPSCITQ